MVNKYFPLNKFDQLRDIVLKYVDILAITETNLDYTFLTSQFLKSGFLCVINYTEIEMELEL